MIRASRRAVSDVYNIFRASERVAERYVKSDGPPCLTTFAVPKNRKITTDRYFS